MKLLIVNFHYLRDIFPASGIYPVARKEFASQLEVLGKGYTFCSQDDIIRWTNGNIPEGNFCLITFDDGLSEQMDALGILDAKGIPAVFYVPAGPYLNGRVLPVHKLHHIRSILTDDELFSLLKEQSSISSASIDPETVKIQYRYDSPLAGLIKYYLNFTLGAGESGILINKVFASVVRDETGFAKSLYMSVNDLNKLASKRMLGSHGRDHKPLATLTPEEVRDDIAGSISFLEMATKSGISSFAYPFGSKAAVNEEVAGQFSGTPVQFALTMFRGVNGPEDIRSRYLLKRVDTNDAPGGKNPMPEFQ